MAFNLWNNANIRSNRQYQNSDEVAILANWHKGKGCALISSAVRLAKSRTLFGRAGGEAARVSVGRRCCEVDVFAVDIAKPA